MGGPSRGAFDDIAGEKQYMSEKIGIRELEYYLILKTLFNVGIKRYKLHINRHALHARNKAARK